MGKVNKYLATFIIIVIAAVAQWFVYPFVKPAPYILFYPSIIIASVYGHGILAIVLACLIAQYFFVEPIYSFKMSWPTDYGRQLLFVICALMIRYITRRLEKAIKDAKINETKYKNVVDAFENSPNAFDIVNEEGKFIYVNQAYLDLWGYDTKEEVLGTSPATHCADPETPIKIITALKETGTCDIEFVAKRKDGSLFDVRMLARLARDAEGKEVYPTSSIDITAKKKAEESLNESLRLRDEFLSVASHELKTPLTTLMLQTQYRLRQISKDNKVFDTESIRKMNQADLKQLTRMSRLIDDMLDISRIRTGKLELKKEKIELCHLVSEVAERLRPQFTELATPLELKECHETFAKIDSFRIEQVITNLLTNALKYGQGKTVTCEVFKAEKFAVITVTDLGRGISVEDQKRIFTVFERAVSANEVSGLGLGLAIAKDIIESHSGKISVVSELGKGSTFKVELPLD